MVRMKQVIDVEDIRLPVRAEGQADRLAGAFARGQSQILPNPIYIGRIAHKGHVHEGHTRDRRAGL